MVWTKQDPWEYRFELARQYKEEHGDLTIPAKYKTSDGIWLGNWLYHQKKLLAGKERGQQLSEAQKMKLMELGIAQVIRIRQHKMCLLVAANILVIID